jgi:hypothetical protein
MMVSRMFVLTFQRGLIREGLSETGVVERAKVARVGVAASRECTGSRCADAGSDLRGGMAVTAGILE